MLQCCWLYPDSILIVHFNLLFPGHHQKLQANELGSNIRGLRVHCHANARFMTIELDFEGWSVGRFTHLCATNCFFYWHHLTEVTTSMYNSEGLCGSWYVNFIRKNGVLYISLFSDSALILNDSIGLNTLFKCQFERSHLTLKDQQGDPRWAPKLAYGAYSVQLRG